MQRDEAIKCVNERANNIEDETSNNNKSEVSPTTSFMSVVSDVEAYTISQESRTSLNDSNAQGLYPESDNSIEEFTAYIHPAKHFNKAPKRPQTPRKRRNAGESSGGGQDDRLAAIFIRKAPWRVIGQKLMDINGDLKQRGIYNWRSFHTNAERHIVDSYSQLRVPVGSFVIK